MQCVERRAGGAEGREVGEGRAAGIQTWATSRPWSQNAPYATLATPSGELFFPLRSPVSPLFSSHTFPRNLHGNATLNTRAQATLSARDKPRLPPYNPSQN